MRTSDFDYHLPPELVAQTPIEPRDRARLMVLNRAKNTIEHHRFEEIVDYLHAGDVMVFNDSRVIPARLSGRKAGTGGRLEILLLHRIEAEVWETLIRPSKRVKVGSSLELASNHLVEHGAGCLVRAEIVALKGGGIAVIKFSDEALLLKLGEIPLPPYIHMPLKDPERYQTVYANESGSAAAPTAGLHFTPELITKIKKQGVHCLFVTLHVGLATFQPVREEDPGQHTMHSEYGVVSGAVAEYLSRAKAEGRRIISIGTTTVRLLETAVRASSPVNVQPFNGWTDLFILPGFEFQLVDVLVTNFHLPKSTLLMLVSAFTGGELINSAYHVAIEQQYRFYSFGDAMMIL